MKIIVYTDGSCNNARRGRIPKVGGYACIIDIEGEERVILRGGEINTTSARMELVALQSSLLHISSNFKDEKIDLIVFTDAEYIVNSFQKGWVYNWIKDKFYLTKNSDVWKTILSQLSLNHISSFSIIHVKGHSGIELNEMADSLAETARQEMNRFNKEIMVKCYKNIVTNGYSHFIYNEL